MHRLLPLCYLVGCAAEPVAPTTPDVIVTELGPLSLGEPLDAPPERDLTIPWDTYAKFAGMLKPPLNQPSREPDVIGYGLNVQLPGIDGNLSWAFIWADGAAPQFAIDADQDGTLDTPISLAPAGGGVYIATRETEGFPWDVRVSGSPSSAKMSFRFDATRTGTASFPKGELAISVTASSGRWSHLVVDLDGDGALDATRNSTERWELDPPPTDLIVDGWRWRVQLAPNGDLVLHQVEPAEPRPTLRPGTPAPPIVRADGSTVDWAGRTNLVIFEAAKCGFCRQLAPDLAALEARSPNLRFVSVFDGTEADAAEWKANHGRQVEPGTRDDPARLAFRVSAVPTAFLIRADGTIIDRAAGRDAILALIDAAPD